MATRRLAAATLLALLVPALAGCPGSKGPPPVDSKAARLHRNLGLAYLEQEKPAKAVGEFQAVAAILPDDPLPYVDLAIARLRLSQPEEAEKWARKALEVAPDEPAAHLALALVEDWKGDEAGADAERAAALAKAPDLLDARYARARYLMKAGRKEEAIGELDLLRERAPGNVVVLSDLASALLEAGRARDAAGVLSEMAALPGGDREARRALASAEEEARAGNAGEALRSTRLATNLLRAGEAFQLASAQVRPNVVGIPMERFATPGLEESEPAAPPETHVRFVDAGDLPSGLGPETWLDADGGRAVAGDLDNDGEPEVARIADREVRVFEVSRGTATETPVASIVPESGAAGRPGSPLNSILTADLDHDGDLDLLATSGEGAFLWRNDGDGSWTDTTGRAGLGGLEDPEDATFADLDGDTDLDVVLGGREGVFVAWNLRLGRFRTEAYDGPGGEVRAPDLDGDGCPEVLSCGPNGGLVLRRNRCDGSLLPPEPIAVAGESCGDVLVFDHDNDGIPDLLVRAGREATSLLRGLGGLRFAAANDRLPGTAHGWTGVHRLDVDGDGDLDLVYEGVRTVRGGGNLLAGWLRNEGGNALGWLDVRLEGLAQGGGKNNREGIGSRVEVWAGDLHATATVRGPVTHFGLGTAPPDLLRVMWPNGVPQSTISPEARTTVAEKEVLKGSCPFLYAWDGEGFAFVTDLLWASPLGLPLPVPEGPEGRRRDVPWDTDEAVKIVLRHTGGEAVPRYGLYELRVTEELWETAYFDRVRLRVVDHPAAMEAYSNQKVQPPPFPEERIRYAARETPPAAATDGSDRDVLALLAAEDGRFLLGGRPTGRQGIRSFHTLVLEPDPSGPADLLLLTGWIFPTDATINAALAQRPDAVARPPVLEAETSPGRWEALAGLSPYPPGKTKTIVLDLPPRARGRRLRIRTNLDIRWDRAAFAADAGPSPGRETVLEAARAELRRHGFSAPWRPNPDGPHLFRYGQVSIDSPWAGVEGPFTRYGDVRAALAGTDDRYVVMGPGDEIALSFEAGDLPDLPPDWERSLFLESDGWDKDADLNTREGWRTRPWPCHAMTAYPPRPGECEGDEGTRRWAREVQTRR